MEEERTIEGLVEDLKPFVEHLRHIYDLAVVAYTPLVDEICSRNGIPQGV